MSQMLWGEAVAQLIRSSHRIFFALTRISQTRLSNLRNLCNLRMSFGVVLSWHFGEFENVGDDCVGSNAVEFGFSAERQAMTQYRKSDVAHIIRYYEVAAPDCSQRFRTK